MIRRLGQNDGRYMCSHRSGAALLEVIISMGLLIFGMAAVGLQVNAGLREAEESDLYSRASLAVDTKLAELHAGVLYFEQTDDEIDGDFGIFYPGFTWRMKIKPCEIQDLYMVTLEIGYNPGAIKDQIADPETYELDIEDEGTRIVHTVYRLYPLPADINLERDTGYSSDEIDDFLKLAGGGGGSPSGSSGDGTGEEEDGQGLGLEDMLEAAGVDAAIVQRLFDPEGFNPRALAELPEEEFMQLATLVEALMSGGTNLIEMQQKLQSGDLADLLNQAGADEADVDGQDSQDDGYQPDVSQGRDMGRTGDDGSRGRERGERRRERNR